MARSPGPRQRTAATQPPATPQPFALRRQRVALALTVLALAVATGAAYWQVLQFPFVEFDDPDYITNNTVVRNGVTVEGIRWAFGIGRAANWHPLTWLSHMLDVQLFGVAPGAVMGTGGHHATNLLLHVLNTGLLCVVLTRMTGALWPSAFVAALFGLHPLHVESVAWVSERKDVLSTLFLLLTVLAYVAHVGRPGRARYALVLLLYALGLMAKQMLVSLPFLLLLLDYWPLRRITVRGDLWRVAKEKLPLVVMAAIASVLVVLAQRAGGAIAPEPLGVRLPNAVVTPVVYLLTMLWPAKLAHFYPLSSARWAWWEVGGCGLALVAVSYASIRGMRRWPMVMVGWWWYLVSLLPVIGIVQIGGQARADRYTYVPLIGIFVAIAYGVPALVERVSGRSHGRVLAAVAGAIVAALIPLTVRQVGYWRSSETLYRHTLAVTQDNWHVHGALASILFRQAEALRSEQQADRARQTALDAADHARRAAALHPGMVQAHTNLGAALTVLAKLEADQTAKAAMLAEAEREYRTVLSLDPDNVIAHSNLATLLMDGKRPDLAIPHYEASLRINPNAAAVYVNLGLALERTGQAPQAADRFRRALELHPADSVAYWACIHLAGLLDAGGQRGEAVALLRQAVQINKRARVDPARNTAERRLAALAGG